jgi:beta-glucosidase
VPPGESVTTRVELPVTACTIVDAAGRRVVEPGEFELLVGSSSRDSDLQRARFTVHAPSSAASSAPTTATA